MLYKSEVQLPHMDFHHLSMKFLFAMLLWTPATIASAQFDDLRIWFNEWVFDDWANLNWFLVIFLLDTFTGMVKHWIQKSFSFIDLGVKTFLNKLLPAGVWFVSVHFIEVIGEIDPGTLSDEITMFFSQGVLGLYMLGSVFDNLYVITERRFPPFWSILRTRFFGRKFNK